MLGSDYPGGPTYELCAGYCNLAYPNFTDGNVKYIREGFEKRVTILHYCTVLYGTVQYCCVLYRYVQLYDADPTNSGSRLCGCNAGPELKCTWLEEIEKKPCNTDSAFYRYRRNITCRLLAFRTIFNLKCDRMTDPEMIWKL